MQKISALYFLIVQKIRIYLTVYQLNLYFWRSYFINSTIELIYYTSHIIHKTRKSYIYRNTSSISNSTELIKIWKEARVNWRTYIYFVHHYIFIHMNYNLPLFYIKRLFTFSFFFSFYIIFSKILSAAHKIVYVKNIKDVYIAKYI